MFCKKAVGFKVVETCVLVYCKHVQLIKVCFEVYIEGSK